MKISLIGTRGEFCGMHILFASSRS